MNKTARELKLLILLVLSSLFLLNDFLLIPAKSFVTWVLIDYATRLSALAIIVFVIRRGLSSPAEFGLKKINLRRLVLWSLFLTVTGILIDQVGWRYFKAVLPETQLMSFPKTRNQFLNAFDWTAGVALVSISEELIFRGYFFSVVKNYIRSTAVIIILSAPLFGLIHWSMGLHAIVSTALWGLLPMVALARTGSIHPAVIAHFLTDIAALSPIIPERWFDFIH